MSCDSFYFAKSPACDVLKTVQETTVQIFNTLRLLKKMQHIIGFNLLKYHQIIYCFEQFIRFFFPLIHSNKNTHGIQPTENKETRRQWDRDVDMLSGSQETGEKKRKAPTVITKKGNESDGVENPGRLEHDETVK